MRSQDEFSRLWKRAVLHSIGERKTSSESRTHLPHLLDHVPGDSIDEKGSKGEYFGFVTL